MAANYYWIKLYYDLLDDRKVGQLPDGLKWRFIECLLVAGEQQADGLLPPVDDLAWRLGRMQPDALSNDLSHLARAGLVELVATDCGERWLVTNFTKRQKAKSNAERQAAWRGRRANITDPLRDSNESVTTRYLDTDKKRKETEEETEKIADFPTLPVDLASPDMMNAWGEWLSYHDERGKPITKPTAMKQFKCFMKWGIEQSIQAIERSIQNGWVGLFEPSDNGKHPKQDDTMDRLKARMEKAKRERE